MANTKEELSSSSFYVLLTGQIDQAIDFPSGCYCRYVLSYGDDWTVVNGVTSSITQLSYSQANGSIVWNFPLEITFRSTNAHGWPRISFGIYGKDFLGRDVVRGYGSVLIPTVQGRHELVVEMYRPVSGNCCHEMLNFFKGTIPEYYETAFTARNQGREVTRVRCEGKLKLTFETLLKDMDTFGFGTVASTSDSKKTR